jgi:RHS repeat-associated protein
MAVTSYYDVNGAILGQESGGSRFDYLADALGSVVSLTDQAKAVTHTARYKPYGSVLANTGTGPGFRWVGTLGYRESGLAHAEHYVRSRHYGNAEGRWRSVDPLWPVLEHAYAYVRSKPISRVDPTGLYDCATVNRAVHEYCTRCYSPGYSMYPGCISKCNEIAKDYYDTCRPGTTKPPRMEHPGEQWRPTPGVGIAPQPGPVPGSGGIPVPRRRPSNPIPPLGPVPPGSGDLPQPSVPPGFRGGIGPIVPRGPGMEGAPPLGSDPGGYPPGWRECWAGPPGIGPCVLVGPNGETIPCSKYPTFPNERR